MAEAAMATNEKDEILCSIEGRIGWITLNRPHALNSLSLNMIRQMTVLLKEWAQDADIMAVVVQGAGEKAFCAGGDVRAAYEARKLDKMDLVEAFFREEYTLNTLIHEYPKPYITILDGIAMGGGLGVSFNSPYAVVTERSILAMPETGIGFFPDVGATWFLSNPPDSIGVYWAMTGHRFHGADAVYGRLSSLFIPSCQIQEMLQALKDTDDVEGTLKIFQSPPAGAPIKHMENEIHKHFDRGSVMEIIKSLENSNTEFAREALATLRAKSPLSIHVAFEQLKNVDPNSTFRERMQREYRLSQRFVKDHDFFEGVRAVLVDKDQNPKWKPERLEDVTPEQVQAYFAPLGDRELVL